MKKSLIVLLALAMIFAFAACGEAPADEPAADTPVAEGDTPADEPTDIEAVDLYCAGSTSTGGFWPQCSAVAAFWEETPYVSHVNMESTTGSVDNVMFISMGDDDFGISSGLVMQQGQDGDETVFGGAVYDNFRVLFNTGTSDFQYIVRADSDINCFQDMVGKVIGTGTAGSGYEVESRVMLEALGITYDQFARVEYLGVGEACGQLQDGKIDVAVVHATYPNASISELATQTDIRMLELSDEEIAILLDTCNWVAANTIPAGTYMGIDEDTQTAGALNVMIVNADMSDDMAYALCQSAYENWDAIKEISSAASRWSWTDSVESLTQLHPGAKAFMQDEGLI